MIDKEIIAIVDALNAAGIKTMASCDGHGFQPGSVIIAYNGVDKEIRLFTYNQARTIDKYFPDINGEYNHQPYKQILTELEEHIDDTALEYSSRAVSMNRHSHESESISLVLREVLMEISKLKHKYIGGSDELQ